ncbi:MAG: glycosyltransferase family 1 protein, partial [Gemmatimonadetes bacterium]|nr:glycosyltransferase family 1 protein [Gemmatimonadota bacterium]
RDSVVDGVTGFLVPHGDLDSLTDRLERLLTDAQLRDRLGAQARAFAERYSWDRAASDTEAHLQQQLRLARRGEPRQRARER